MTDPVSNIGSMLDILRRQLTRRGTSNAADSPGTAVQGAQARTRSKTATVQQRMRDRVAKLDPLDPHYNRKARRVFLQIVLADEFGDQIANDPAFFRLLEEVEKLMDQNEKLAKAFDALFSGRN